MNGGKKKVSRLKAARTERCSGCGFCESVCNSVGICTGCGACVIACPNEARYLEEHDIAVREVEICVDGERIAVPEHITLLNALEMAGFRIFSFKNELKEKEIIAPCRTGGCWACAVIVDGELMPSCITPVTEGMNVITSTDEPMRTVSGFQGHPVGGVGTPYWVKPRLGAYMPVEVACFAHGCNLRCPTCQNWRITYSSQETPLTPMEAAKLISYERIINRVDRIAISGGECTLNRKWLISYIKSLKLLNTDERVRIHVDTNTTFLTPDYIDELVHAGMTDIGVDIKARRVDTFMRISGLNDGEIAEKFLKNAWNALKYLVDEYSDRIFIGVGIPYNSALISRDEIAEIGERIAAMSDEVQVCALDYRPEFRRIDIKKPNYEEMMRIKEILNQCGLKCVICQTEFGRIGP